jgi:RNA polymerase sigma-70 factor (ECF subfamily)
MFEEAISIDSPNISAPFEDFYGEIFRYALSLLHDPAEAEDVAQETFLRAYRRLDPLPASGSLMAWLYRIATRIGLDRIRKQARYTSEEPEADLDELEVADRDLPSLPHIAEQNSMSACAQRYLDSLPASDRAVILLHDLDELTGPEIAETLSVSLTTVKIRLQRAHRKLHALLEAGCAYKNTTLFTTPVASFGR